MQRRKISIIGAGFTGATTAFILAQRELGDIVLVDTPEMENPTKGKALDMLEAGAILGFDTIIIGTSDYVQTAGSDLVIITAGMPRTPGMTRNDLIQMNQAVVQEVAHKAGFYSPDAIILVLTNPVDIMTYIAYQASGFPKHRVLGQSGILDGGRFRTFIALELGVSVKKVTGFVLGGHGDEMVPLVRYTYVDGVPVEKLISKKRLDEIVARTRVGGGEIVNLLGSGSAYYAPAASMVEMVEAILLNQKRELPAIAYLNGEYGLKDIYLGVPTILGRNGIEEIIEVDLLEEEQMALEQSAESVRHVLRRLIGIRK